MSEVLTFNFTQFKNTLFTGRKNGRKYRCHLQPGQPGLIVLKAREEQLITSSFFLGLFEEVLVATSVNVMSESALRSNFDTSQINERSQSELKRAIRRYFLMSS